jgi:GrpB-like predicted nucleotidyltransferase (UPF0157 family)
LILTSSRFSKLFAAERDRLLAALHSVLEGGVVESIQHVGSTSMNGAEGSGVVDIAMAAWPFPLAGEVLAALRGLGYRLVPGFEGEPEQRFRHARKPVQLLVVEPGSDAWQNFITLRDYLSQLPPAAPRHSASRKALAKHAHRFDRLLPRANAWWVAEHGFSPVEAAAAELAGFGRPWHIASGWAIDLFLGQVNRVHHDVDVEIARDDQLALRAHLEARGWKFVTPYESRLEPWPPDTRLEGARHQAHAHRDGAFIDCLFTTIAGGVWYYRRQPDVVRLLARATLRTSSGVPYLAPELALLFKSKNTGRHERSQDQADFERACPRLEPERRAWLRWALMATNPGLPWLERLVG